MDEQPRRRRRWLALLALLAVFLGALLPTALSVGRALAGSVGDAWSTASAAADGDEDLDGPAGTRHAAPMARPASADSWHGWKPAGADPSDDRRSSRNPAAAAPPAIASASSRAGARVRDARDPGDDLAGPRDSRAHAPTRAAGEPTLAGLPGRATPVAAPDVGSVHAEWDYRFGGDIYHCTTTLEIGAGDGTRRPAVVTTRDDAGQLLVSYNGKAFLDSQGALHVDARGAAVSGPWASRWSPDSFAVDQYGQVRTLDDFDRGGGGWVTP